MFREGGPQRKRLSSRQIYHPIPTEASGMKGFDITRPHLHFLDWTGPTLLDVIPRTNPL